MRHASYTLASAIAASVAAITSTSANAQVLFSDNFDAGTSAANYDVFSANPASDFSATFAENYGLLSYTKANAAGDDFETLQVPSAPRSAGGTTTGLVMRINDASNAVNSMSAYPKSQNFSGNYKLTFDMWINYNGPAEGGGASTEWMLAGINQGTVGNKVAGPVITGSIGGQNTGNTFAVNGERGNGQDYRTYINQTNQGARGFAAPTPSQQNGELNPYYSDPVTGLFPAPEYETSGAPGKHWVTVEMSQIASVITWKINGSKIAAYADKTANSGNITLGYADFNFGSAAAADAPFQFVVYDNIIVEAAPTSLYWDIDGATVAGAGGAAPTGSWDGIATNFNSDSAGFGAGVVTPFTSDLEDVVFTAGTDGTGSYTVNVTGPQAAKSIAIARGNVTLTGGSLSTGTFNVAAGASGTVASVVNGGATNSLTKSGVGTLTLTAANTHSGGTTVSAGKLVAANADALGTGSLTVNTAAVAEVQAGLTKALSVASVTTAGTGKLDLTNNSMVVKNSSLAAVQAAITSGFNFGDWLGAGITSSTAATEPNGLTALGYLDNVELGASDFEGVSGLDSDDILVKYTYYGDADLSGHVTLDDFNQFLNGYQNPVLATWLNGDFDYSGVVTLDDFNQFLFGYQSQGAPLTLLADAVAASSVSSSDRQFMQASIAAVPEPASLGLLGLAAAGLLGRRRRA